MKRRSCEETYSLETKADDAAEPQIHTVDKLDKPMV